jgi:hypothetical protein
MELERLVQGVPLAVRIAGLLLLVVFILGRTPGLKLLVLPLSVFGVIVHELAHGLVAILSGGRFKRFTVTWNPTSTEVEGEALREGGVGCLITSAGYLGTIFIGGVLLVLATSEVPASLVLLALGVLVALVCLVYVRNLFGMVSGLAVAALFVLVSQRLPEIIARGLLWLLAMQLFIDSFVHLIYVPQDAVNLQKRTGVPMAVWVVLWQVIAIGIVLYALHLAYGLPLPWEALRRRL